MPYSYYNAEDFPPGVPQRTAPPKPLNEAGKNNADDIINNIIDTVTEHSPHDKSADIQPDIYSMDREGVNVTGAGSLDIVKVVSSMKWPDWLTPPVQKGMYIGAAGMGLALIVL